ncbi:MAG: hypothetical protein DCE92_01980 [Alphaproteobacteria bacterium]|nr:MAG: hypothetical protein DCE92_01980 [Alphaproteobacteria bacterium]
MVLKVGRWHFLAPQPNKRWFVSKPIEGMFGALSGLNLRSAQIAFKARKTLINGALISKLCRLVNCWSALASEVQSAFRRPLVNLAGPLFRRRVDI